MVVFNLSMLAALNLKVTQDCAGTVISVVAVCMCLAQFSENALL